MTLIGLCGIKIETLRLLFYLKSNKFCFINYRRETEAVEQVRQSVHMAEQISLEKTQVELELTQVKQQLERQQDRIKGIQVRFTFSTSTFIWPGLCLLFRISYRN